MGDLARLASTICSRKVPRDGVCKQLRIEVVEQVDTSHVDGVDGLGVHQTKRSVCGGIGQGLTDQTLKNIHAVVGRYPWSDTCNGARLYC